MEQTLIIIKPDAVQRGLIGEITSRFEKKGLKIIGMKMMTLNEAVLKEHYAHLVKKPFYEGLEKFMRGSPVIVMCVEGLEAVKTVRLLCGVTNAREALPGTIRGDFAMSTACNVVHASDSLEIAKKEIKRFFKESELYEYDKTEYMHVYGEDEK